MGQYHFLCNLDKKEFVNPHRLGDGLKVWEQCASGPGGIGSACVALLACPTPRGGGDLERCEAYGRWHGDRVALVGDYAENSDLPPVDQASGIYGGLHSPSSGWKDISEIVEKLLSKELGITYTGDGWRGRTFHNIS